MGQAINELDGFQLFTQGFSFRDIIGQDRWTKWTPVRTGWTDGVAPAPTVSALWRDVGSQCFLQIKVVPGTTVATLAGTSYITLPRAAAGLCGHGSMQDLTTLTAIGDCVVSVSNSRLYLPTWAASGDTILIWASWQL